MFGIAKQCYFFNFILKNRAEKLSDLHQKLAGHLVDSMENVNKWTYVKNYFWDKKNFQNSQN